MTMPKVAKTAQVQQPRARKTREGYRYIQLLVPDTRRPEFVEECKRQWELIADADEAGEDAELLQFLDDALASTEGWTA